MSPDENVSMNKELKKWIKESKKNFENYKKKNESIKPSGNCQVCGVKQSEFVCIKCNRPVCKSCYFKIIGICKMCVPKNIAKRWDGSAPDWEKILGVEWID